MRKILAVGMACLLGFQVFAQDVPVQGIADPQEGGKVTGPAVVAPGKSVTLTASPAKGWAFTAWQDGNQTAKRGVPYAEALAATNAAGVAEYTASFLKVADLDKPVVTPVDGVVTGMVGVALSLPITYDSLSAATLKASKLPSGLVLKDGVISGVPKKATGDAGMDVTLTASNAAGTSAPVQITIFIYESPFPSKGTFSGFFMKEIITPADEPDQLYTNTVVTGTFTLTASASGKMSAKTVTEKGKMSFSAKSWATLEDYGLTAVLTSSKGETLALTYSPWHSYGLSGTVTGGVFAGTDWWLTGQWKNFDVKGKIISDDWSYGARILYRTCYCPIKAGFSDYYYEEKNGITQKVFYAVSPMPKVSCNVAFANVGMMPLGDAGNTPQGHGYVTATLNLNGSVKFAGKMADGNAFSGSTTSLVDEFLDIVVAEGDEGELPDIRFVMKGEVMIPLCVPMYNGQGLFSSLLAFAEEWNAGTKSLEQSFGWVYTYLPSWWVYPGKAPAANPPQTEDAFQTLLSPLGSVYSPYMDLSTWYTRKEVFVASEPDLSYTYTKGDYTNTVDAWTELFPNVQLLTKPTVTLPKGKAPALKNDTYIIADAKNPSAATFTLTKNSGVFKGKFNVYYDYTDENGATKLKTVPVKHEGVMLPYYVQSPYPSGAGFYLMPDAWVDTANPAKPVTYKLNRSFGVQILPTP